MPLLKRLHKVAPNYTPKIAALDGCQAQNRQAAAPPPCHSLSHLTHAQCSEAVEINLALKNLLHAQHPS